MKSFIDGMLYLVNIFYRNATMTTVLREEDINFPPTTDNFRDSGHPVLKDLTLEGILGALKSNSTIQSGQFASYLNWMHSMLLTAAWTMEPNSLEFM